MELCIATKSKTETAQSSMLESKNYQKKCHQNQTNTQESNCNRSDSDTNNRIRNRNRNHRDRNHLRTEPENQRTTNANATSSTLKCSRSKNSSSCNSNTATATTQLNTLYLLLVLLIVGLATVAATPSPSSFVPLFARENRRDALLAYYKRAHLPPNSIASTYDLADSQEPGLEQDEGLEGRQFHLHDSSALDFDELTPTASVVSALSRAERFRLRKRSATPTTPATATTPTPGPGAAAAAVSARMPKSEGAVAATAESIEEKCEPKVLETQPDEPVSGEFSFIGRDYR